MRSIITKFALLFAVATFVASCEDVETFYEPDKEIVDDNNNSSDDKDDTQVETFGYLSLDSLNVSVLQVDEVIVDSSTKATTTRAEVAPATDTDKEESPLKELTDDQLAICWLAIKSSNLKDPVTETMTYADFYNNLDVESAAQAGYPLLPAQYEITVDDRKPAEMLTEAKNVVVKGAAAADLGAPRYRGHGEFQIKANEVTNNADMIKCELNNVKATLEIAADLKALFKPADQLDTEAGDIPLKATVRMGLLTYEFDGSEAGTAIYFDPESVGKVDENDTNDKISITLSGMFNVASGDQAPSYAKIENWSQEITGVTEGQSRKIGIRVEHANEGNAQIVITVENWVYNDKIDVDVMKSYASSLVVEEGVVDPESLPGVTLVGGGENNTRFIPMEGDVDRLSYIFTPRDEASIVSVTSSTPNILDGKEMTWNSTDQDLGEFAALYTVSISERTGKVTMNATDYGMEVLTAAAASYNTSYTVVDSKGRTTKTQCTVNVGEATPPTIIWRDKDINKRQEITAEGLDFIIDITSSTSITGFTVDIASLLLTPEELAGSGLNAHMDLINPDPSYAGGLANLGFPMGDAINGKSDVVFDVSSFMTTLYLLGNGDSDFTLNVTNSAGKTTSITAGVFVGSTENPNMNGTGEIDGLSIVWDGDYSFDTRYDINMTTYPTVKIDITADDGIKNLMVQINSDKLSAAELEEMGLAQEMDIANPTTDKMSGALNSLGFPTGDAVTGQTAITIDITQFMPALSALGEGNTDFVLTAVDNNDKSVSKTIMVKAIQ